VGVIGNIGGVFVPMIVGYLRTETGSFTAGFLVVSAVMIVVALFTVASRLSVENAVQRKRNESEEALLF
jgi:nitrate/nitrite transporter NarK